MMSFSFSGGVEVYGFIAPTEITDEYPVIDPLYGIDGFRNVDTLSDLNSIPNLRRRAGMVVGIGGGTQYYKLNPGPWNGTITDWTIFNSGGGGGTFTGGTVTGPTIFTNGLTANTLTVNGVQITGDTYTTGGTYSNGTIDFYYNTGGGYQITGLYTGETSYVNSLTTGTGLSADTTTGNITIINTDPDQVVSISGGTNIGISGTYPNFGVNFTGDTSSFFTGGTVTGDTIFTQGLSATTFSASTYLGLPLDVYTTGFTFNPSNYDISIKRNDGVTLTQNLSILASDVTITGGTYNPLNGVATFTNNTGGTFTVSGFITGFTDVQVTGYTYQNNTFTIYDSSGNTFPATIDVMTGLTVNGVLSATTISAATYQNLPATSLTVGSTQISSGTDGRVLFQSGTTLQQDSGLFWDNTNKFLQIYKTIGGEIRLTCDFSAVQKYSFYQNISSTQTEIANISNQFGTGMILSSYDNLISFNPGNTERARITSIGLGVGTTSPFSGTTNIGVGNVDIGTFGSPNYNLNVRGYSSLGSITQNGFGAVGSNYYLDFNNQLRSRYASRTSLIDFSNGGFLFKNADSVSANNNISVALTEKMRLTYTGELGIGTTTPSEKLDVSGKTKTINLQVTSGATTGYVLTSDASGNATWQSVPTFTGGTVNGLTATTISASTISAPGSNTQVIYNNNGVLSADTGFVYSGGSVGIGTTTPSFKLEVNGTSMFRNNMALNQGVFSGTYTYNSFTDNNKTSLYVGRFHDHTDGAVDVGYTSQFRWDKRQSSNISIARSIDIPVNFTAGSSGTVGQFNSINTQLQIIEGSTVTTPFVAHSVSASKGTTGTVTSFTGFDVQDNSVSNTTYGFRSRLTSGTGKYGLYFDGSANNYFNGNVGIGTTSPSARLDVRAQGVLSTDIVFRVRNSGDTVNYLVVNGAGDVYNNGAGGISTNTFYGENVGRSNVGGFNTFIGNFAGSVSTVANDGTFIGANAGKLVTTGIRNTFVGSESGAAITSGDQNTFVGRGSGASLNGYDNTIVGANSFVFVTSGNDNVTLGREAGRKISAGTDMTTSNQSIFIGSDTRASGNSQTNQIVIGHTTIGLGSNTTVIGNSSTTLFRPYGNVAIGKDSASETLDVSGKTKTINLQVTSGATTGYVLTSDASGNATWQVPSVTADTFTTGFTYSNNTFTITRNQGQPNLTATINSVTGLTVNGNLTVTGNTSLQSFTGTTGLISAATQNVLTIIGSGNSTTSPIFKVQGSQGELFSISDSLTGSLFSVNDISGLPILEVFSDNTTLIGSYLAPSLNTTAKVTATTGTTNVYSIPTSAYTGAFFDYTVSDGTNLRAGNIMSIWSGTSVNYSETSTTDFGNTSGLTFNMVVSSGNAILRTSGATGNWTVKTIVRSI